MFLKTEKRTEHSGRASYYWYSNQDIPARLFMLPAETISQISSWWFVCTTDGFTLSKHRWRSQFMVFPEFDSEQSRLTAVKLNFAVAASCQVNQLSSIFYDYCWNTWVKLKWKVLWYPNTDTDSGLKINFCKLLVEMKITLYNVASLLFLLTCSKWLVSDHF